MSEALTFTATLVFSNRDGVKCSYPTIVSSDMAKPNWVHVIRAPDNLTVQLAFSTEQRLRYFKARIVAALYHAMDDFAFQSHGSHYFFQFPDRVDRLIGQIRIVLQEDRGISVKTA